MEVIERERKEDRMWLVVKRSFTFLTVLVIYTFFNPPERKYDVTYVKCVDIVLLTGPEDFLIFSAIRCSITLLITTDRRFCTRKHTNSSPEGDLFLRYFVITPLVVLTLTWF